MPSTPERSEQRGDPVPDLDAVHRIHTAHDGFVTLHQGADAGVVRCVRAGDLLQLPAAHRRQLTADAYYSINGFYRPRRRTTDLRWLTANFIDLDYYAAGLSYGAAVGAVVDAERAGWIPTPSVLVDSGRGLWLLWCLRDRADPSRPVAAWPENVRRWRATQQSLYARLAHLGADACAIDAARITRLPGSTNTKSESAVRYWFAADDRGRPIRYRLDEIAERVGASQETRRPRQLHAQPTRPIPARAAGYRAMYEGRVDQLRALEQLRGGFRKGHRYYAALLLANFLGRLGEPAPSIERAVRTLGGDCRTPDGRAMPLEAGRLQKAARTWSRITRLRNQTIADWLTITPDESQALHERFSAKAWPPAAPHEAVVVAVEETRAARTERRRHFVRTIVQELGGDLPSLREMRTRLAERGLNAALATISRDYRALGLVDR